MIVNKIFPSLTERGVKKKVKFEFVAVAVDALLWPTIVTGGSGSVSSLMTRLKVRAGKLIEWDPVYARAK